MLLTIHYSPFTIYRFRLPAWRVVASSATAAIPTTTAAAAAIAAITTATTTAASATATIFPWSGLIYCEVATGQVSAIKLFDCFFAFFFRSHLNEPKTA
jgi:hypothetical protein